MDRRKHHNKKKNKNMKRWKKSITLMASLLLVMGAIIGGVVAFLVDKDEPITNTFIPSAVTTEVDETLNENTKSDVKLKNTGDTTAYIRVAVIVTWQDGDGNIYGQAPSVGTDYSIQINTSGQKSPEGTWTLAADGFYYWSGPVKSVKEDAEKCFTGILITECKSLKACPDEDYHLNVEIIGSGIQSVPASVVETEWNTGVEKVNGDGTLSIIKP